LRGSPEDPLSERTAKKLGIEENVGRFSWGFGVGLHIQG